MEQLIAYDWPGNIRELQNVIERAMILSSGSTLVLNDTLVPGERPKSQDGQHCRDARARQAAGRKPAADAA
jgi:formate hydrogenlyase transcriptional activator